MAREPDDFRLLLDGEITSQEYVDRLTERVRRQREAYQPRYLTHAEAERVVEIYKRRGDERAAELEQELRRIKRRAFWDGFWSVFGWRR